LASKIRLEAATRKDSSLLVDIPKPDGMKERAQQFVKWLAKEHPEGKWGQFLEEDGSSLRWIKVILSGISHGSTTVARFAMHQKMDRVLMSSGPRDTALPDSLASKTTAGHPLLIKQLNVTAADLLADEATIQASCRWSWVE
jgi:hypothetical protein